MRNRNERNSSIELLRIFCMLGVIVLHYNNPLYGGAYTHIVENTMNWFLLHWLDCVFVIAVDEFMIITGYFLSTRLNVQIFKICELILRVMLYSLVLYLIGPLLGGKYLISIKGCISHLIPTNYFVILYSVVFLVSPFINFLFMKLENEEIKKFFVIILIIFSVEPTLVDVITAITGNELVGLSSIGAWGSQSGYTFVNFMLLYICGSYLRKFKARYNKWVYGIIFFANSLLMLAFQYFNDKINCGYVLSEEYCSPFVILNAICVFRLFEGMKIKNKTINFLAAGSFSVFLLHLPLVRKINVKWACEQNVLILLLHVVLSSACIYLVCSLIHYLYDFVTKPFILFLRKKTEKWEIKIGKM